MRDDAARHRIGPDHWPLAGTVRRTPVTTATFGGLTFTCGMTIRRADDTVVVQVESPERPADIVAAFRDVGVAQLAFHHTLCRARAVGWDTALGAVVFELHRPVLPEVAASALEVPRAA
jgi:hypothetical protein